MNRLLVAAAALSFAVLAPSRPLLADEWKIASAAPAGAVLAQAVDAAALAATSAAGGAVTVERHQITNEQEIAQQLVRGRLEMAALSATGVSVVVPEAAQAAIRGSMPPAAEQRAAVAAFSAGKAKVHVEAGGHYHQPTAEQRAAFAARR